MKRFLLLLPLLLLPLAACGELTARQIEQKKAMENQAKLNVTTPIPVLPVSQERLNLVDRAKRINVQNMSSCVTLFTKSGAVAAFFPVKGKVSSLNSYLLAGDQVTSGGYVIEQADIDGAYGKNAEGIFFFTADTNAYVETTLDYFWSDQCLKPATSPLMTTVINLEE